MTKDEALQMCLEYIETNTHERKYVRHAIKEALAKQEQGEPVAWAEEIIDDFYALYNSEMIKENNSGDELIRLDAAICVVEEAAQKHTTPPTTSRSKT